MIWMRYTRFTRETDVSYFDRAVGGQLTRVWNNDLNLLPYPF